MALFEPNPNKEKKMCNKCGRAMDLINFYRSNNLERFPNGGYVDECKKCFTMHINNFEVNTFIGLLEILDMPYIEAEWNVILQRHASPEKIHQLKSTTILGRYVSKMRLEQFKHYRFADGPSIAEAKRAELQQKHDIAETRRKAREALLSEAFKEQLTEEDIMNLTDEELESLYEKEISLKEAQGGFAHDLYNPETYMLPEDSLTNDDRIHLSLKWGKLYKPQEWIQLEKFFAEMMDAFDIQTPSHIDYLKMICKTSLKMNSAIDCGDLEGFNKLSKVYDNLMKSSNFTAAQNKASSGEFVDSVGELVYHYEENHGFVPEFHLDEPKDIVDITLKDFKDYTYRLVTEERGLGDMIESSLAKMMEMQQQEEDELDENDDFLAIDEAEILDDAGSSLFDFDEDEEVSGAEISEYMDSEFIEPEVSRPLQIEKAPPAPSDLDKLLNKVKIKEDDEEDGITRSAEYDF